MPTSPPDTGPTSGPIDTSEMATIHSAYRRELRLAAGLVRGVPAGDVARAAVVAGHLRWVLGSLHHHHEVEDDLLWPLLRERRLEDLQPLVDLMERQHERIHRLLDAVAERRDAWAATADRPGADALARACDELYAAVAEHLDAEEERLLPIAARTLTQQEWDALGRAGRDRTPRSERVLAFGMFQHDGDPEVLARMLRGAPLPVRRLLPVLARRAFRRHAVRVHGTASP